MHRAASGTGGGPALQVSLTDIENRVMQIIGVQAATGMEVAEAGFQQQLEENPMLANPVMHTAEDKVDETAQEEITEEHWNIPGTSSQPTVGAPVKTDVPPPTPTVTADSEKHWTPLKKKKKVEDYTKLFVESDRNAREYARERDLAYERLETERLRLREYEIRERVRQRDQELYLQAQWLEFLKEGLNVIKRYFNHE